MNQPNFNFLALPVAKASPETEAGTTAEAQTNAVETQTGTEAPKSSEEHSGGLSIQPTTFLSHGLNFVLLIVILNLILYKPLTKLLADREKKIREGVENAEKAEVMVNEASTTKANILKQASMESQSLMEKARQAGETLKNEIVEEAHKEAEHIVKAGQQAVEMEKAKTLQELQVRAADLVVTSVEKILNKKLKQEGDAELIQNSIQSYQT